MPFVPHETISVSVSIHLLLLSIWNSSTVVVAAWSVWIAIGATVSGAVAAHLPLPVIIIPPIIRSALLPTWIMNLLIATLSVSWVGLLHVVLAVAGLAVVLHVHLLVLLLRLVVDVVVVVWVFRHLSFLLLHLIVLSISTWIMSPARKLISLSKLAILVSLHVKITVFFDLLSLANGGCVALSILLLRTTILITGRWLSWLLLIHSINN